MSGGQELFLDQRRILPVASTAEKDNRNMVFQHKFFRERSITGNRPLLVPDTPARMDRNNAALAACFRHDVRDSRVVERKKYGRHTARKRPQYSKR